MARARNIKPGLFTDEGIADCSIPARYLFVGLWTLADWCGRLEDKPRRIKLQIFPEDTVDCDELLSELANAGMIERYVIDGHGLIEVNNFLKHQNPHPNERKKVSLYPDKSGLVAINHDKAATNPSGSLIPDPGSLIPDPDKPPNPLKGAKPNPNGLSGIQNTQFEEFISSYPQKRRNRGDALRAWKGMKPLPKPELFAKIMDSLEKHKTWTDWTKDGGAFIPGAGKWLRGQHWCNEPEGEIIPEGHFVSNEQINF